jgi:hypothetical protein
LQSIERTGIRFNLEDRLISNLEGVENIEYLFSSERFQEYFELKLQEIYDKADAGK